MGSLEPLKIQIAICGAGIAGLTAAIALRKLPNVDVRIYEQATELREIGASIALGPNGLRTLQRLGVDNAIADEIAYRGPANIPMIYRHWKTNDIIGVDNHKDVDEHLHRTARYYRAHLHEALLEHVPRDIIHLGKKFVAADIDAEGVTLQFKNETTARADILVGADGLRSGVRNHFAPDLKLKWSGWTAFRALYDYSEVESIPNIPQDSTHWWGPHTTFFASRLGKNLFTVVGGAQDDPNNPEAAYKNAVWDQAANVKITKELYSDWSPIVKALAERTLDIRYYPNFAVEKSLDAWVFHDRVTLIGDAAHAHGGAFATGGSLAIDDAYALSLAISSIFPSTDTKIPTAEAIHQALRIYERTRKPHADRLLKVVHSATKNKAETIGSADTDDLLRKKAAERLDTTWLHERDVVEVFNKTVNGQTSRL